jgi:hypothetical protein
MSVSLEWSVLIKLSYQYWINRIRDKWWTISIKTIDQFRVSWLFKSTLTNNSRLTWHRTVLFSTRSICWTLDVHSWEEMIENSKRSRRIGPVRSIDRLRVTRRERFVHCHDPFESISYETLLLSLLVLIV